MDLSFTPRTLPLLERTAAFTERRHDVLAGNIANITTPDYKTRDLPVSEFQAALQQAMTPQSSNSPRTTSGSTQSASERLEEIFPQKLFRAQERDTGDLTYQDGSNRSIEKEVMEMTRNSLMQNYAVELMVSQFRMLEMVVSERA